MQSENYISIVWGGPLTNSMLADFERLSLAGLSLPGVLVACGACPAYSASRVDARHLISLFASKSDLGDGILFDDVRDSCRKSLGISLETGDAILEITNLQRLDGEEVLFIVRRVIPRLGPVITLVDMGEKLTTPTTVTDRGSLFQVKCSLIEELNRGFSRPAFLTVLPLTPL